MQHCSDWKLFLIQEGKEWKFLHLLQQLTWRILERLKGYLSKIMVSSNHLLSLINDVLDMSRH